MSHGEKERREALRGVSRGAITLEQATSVLHLSYRQVKRIWKRYLAEGESGLVHRSRGRPSNRAFSGEFKSAVLRRFREESGETGPMGFTERLHREGIALDHETLRRWLIEGGLWTPRRTRRPKPPATHRDVGFGEMLDLVCRPGAWLGPARPECWLSCLVDEGTSISLCLLSHDGSWRAAMHLLWSWVDRYGLPAAVRCCPRRFVDSETPTAGPAPRPSTQPPRTPWFDSCERLGIETGDLASAQETRLLADLRPVTDAVRDALHRCGAATVEEGTRHLLAALGQEVNATFAVRPRQLTDYHVPIIDRTDLRTIFCRRRERIADADSVVEVDHQYFRPVRRVGEWLPPIHRVVVSEWLDGSLHFTVHGRELPFEEVPSSCLRQAFLAM